MERQLIVCENDARPTDWPTDPKAVRNRTKEKIDHVCTSVTAARSKGITGKELMSFFSYFQTLAVKDQWYIDRTKQIPI